MYTQVAHWNARQHDVPQREARACFGATAVGVVHRATHLDPPKAKRVDQTEERPGGFVTDMRVQDLDSTTWA